MIVERLHSRITRRLVKKYWAHPSIDFGSAFGGLQKDFDYDLAVDGFLDNASKYVPYQKIDLDLLPYPLEDNKYELITCFGTIHYLKNPAGFLKEASRIGTDDATMIISLTVQTFISNMWSFVLRIPSFHKNLFKVEFDKLVANQSDWKLIETDANISKSKYYYVFKKVN